MSRLKDWWEGNSESAKAKRAARDAKKKALAEAYGEYMKTDAYKAEIASYVAKQNREEEERKAKVARGEHIWDKNEGRFAAYGISLLVTGAITSVVLGLGGLEHIATWLRVALLIFTFIATTLIAYQVIRLVRWILDVGGVWKARERNKS